jgi:DNA polymerase-1
MIRLDREFVEKNLGTRILMQVHDELVFEVPKDKIDIVKPLVREVLETIVDFPVRLTVDI